MLVGCALQVSWPRAIDKGGVTVDLASALREVGGPVAVTRRDPVRLRVYLDHSALEARSWSQIYGLLMVRCAAKVVIQKGCSSQRRVSAAQVFLGTGEALSTRVYRRQAPLPDGVSAGVHILAHGGSVTVSEGAAYLMGSIWT